MSGRGKSQKSIELIEAARRILAEIHPATLRAVCYRLFIEKRIPDMNRNSTNSVSRLLVGARERGEIPWEWIVDETREPERVSSWDDPQQLLDCAMRGYRKNYWRDQPHRVEVWSEKGTVRGTLAPVLDQYGVTFRVMHGYGSATVINSIAEESLNDAKPFTALYVGDYDPSGMHMSEVDLPGRIARYGGNVTVQRIALVKNDTKKMGPTLSFPAADKVSDSRFGWFTARHGKHCWELDAMSPPVLRERVELAIESFLDMDAWEHAVEVEAAEIKSMRTFLQGWPGISGQANKYGAR